LPKPEMRAARTFFKDVEVIGIQAFQNACL
jgi:hypothetical protein